MLARGHAPRWTIAGESDPELSRFQMMLYHLDLEVLNDEASNKLELAERGMDAFRKLSYERRNSLLLTYPEFLISFPEASLPPSKQRGRSSIRTSKTKLTNIRKQTSP